MKSGTKSRSRKSVTLPLRAEDSPPFWAENRKITVIQAATAPHSRQRRRSRFLFISDLGHQAADLIGEGRRIVDAHSLDQQGLVVQQPGIGLQLVLILGVQLG